MGYTRSPFSLWEYDTQNDQTSINTKHLDMTKIKNYCNKMTLANKKTINVRNA